MTIGRDLTIFSSWYLPWFNSFLFTLSKNKTLETWHTWFLNIGAGSHIEKGL